MQNIGIVNILINGFLDGRNACYLAYIRSANLLVLVNDAGAAGGPFAGAMPIDGSTGSISNGQCRVDGIGSSVTSNGTTMTLTLNMAFFSAFAGNRVVYMAARSVAEVNSGWRALGVWQVPGATPAVISAVSATPPRGSTAAQSIVFTFTDTKGAGDIGVANVLVNEFLDGRNACYLAYVGVTNEILLVNDAGAAGGPFARLTLNGTPGTIQNTQCQINGTGSSSVLNGNTLTLTLNMTFTGAFAGNRILFLAARDGNGLNNTDWQPLGTWTVPTSGPPAPTISDFNPKTGPAGTLVSLAGANLVSATGVPVAVSMPQLGGGVITVPVSTSSATNITFVIPAGAATGTVRVANAGGNATSTAPFTVTASNSFTISASPSTLNLIAGQSAAFSVRLTSTNGFSQLALLSLSALPAGISSSFKPQMITAGQTSVLTLTAPAGQALGGTALTLSAAATVDGLPMSQSAPAQLVVQAPTTSFIGRTVVSDALQTPLAGVTVKAMGKDGSGGNTGCNVSTLSDAVGNFALTNLPPGCVGPQLFGFDGLTATSPAGKYAGVNLVFTLVSGQVTASPVLVHLPRIDDKETFFVQQNAASDQSYSYRTVPGLAVTVYAGTTFTMPDGTTPNPFPLAGIQVPVDRLPDAKPPVPTMVSAFIVAFQPANARSSQPVAVYYPNTLNTPAGSSMAMMTLDPTRGRMVPYGTATVSSDATQIVPDFDPAFPGKRYGIVNFDWHGPMPNPQPAVTPSAAGGGACGGEGGGSGSGGGGSIPSG